MAGDELKLAASFLRDGQHQAARRLLVPYVKAHPQDASGWFLLSYALDASDKKVECVRRALKIDPSNARAQKRLQNLLNKAQSAPPPSASSSGKTPPFLKREEPSPANLSDMNLPQQEKDWTPEWAKSIPPVQSKESAYQRSSQTKKQPRSELESTSIKEGSNLKPFLVIGVALLCFITIIGGIIGYPTIREFYYAAQSTRSAVRVERVAAQLGTTQPTLPPSWTPTPEPSITPTRTITPTITNTPPPTLVPPSDQDLEEMDTIQVEVADLRGLSVLSDTQSYVLDKGRVRPILEDLFFSSGGTQAEVEDQKRSLIALGLVKPTYNMFDNILNNIADGIGGFYDPLSQEIFILGFSFGGVEHYIYAHEFDHALVDQHFPLDAYGNYPICLTNEDQCKAVDALIEGDASLLMDQWWDQYASVQDYQDILRYNPPWYTLPEQFPPPYASVDAFFSYLQGRNFVEYLYNRGNWAEVNKAYQDPPESTEQILHPEKYIASERPLRVQTAEILPVLGEGWRELSNDTLGEWGTYLLLGYSADLEAQIDIFTAEAAAAGWGGDTYQVYYNDELDQSVMSARWIWDTNTDTTQFNTALLDYMDSRFRGAKVNRSDAECWEANGQASCVFRAGREVLWLLAPNQTVLNDVLAAVPGFP
ncbi:MAG: hypothetical protein PVH60_09285 [Anaerolineales bacterium]|jgi:hypothetical protein